LAHGASPGSRGRFPCRTISIVQHLNTSKSKEVCHFGSLPVPARFPADRLTTAAATVGKSVERNLAKPAVTGPARCPVFFWFELVKIGHNWSKTPGSANASQGHRAFASLREEIRLAPSVRSGSSGLGARFGRNLFEVETGEWRRVTQGSSFRATSGLEGGIPLGFLLD
jgi:hypothetical protein